MSIFPRERPIGDPTDYSPRADEDYWRRKSEQDRDHEEEWGDLPSTIRERPRWPRR